MWSDLEAGLDSGEDSGEDADQDNFSPPDRRGVHGESTEEEIFEEELVDSPAQGHLSPHGGASPLHAAAAAPPPAAAIHNARARLN